MQMSCHFFGGTACYDIRMELRKRLSDSERTRAWERRDPSYDGLFFFGVKTTGIFCSPSCPSQPKRENLEFFDSAGEAVRAGYRPCKRCEPINANGAPPKWISDLMDRVEKNPETKISAKQLRELGIAPEKVRRWFQKHHGMTFVAWCRGLKLSRAFTQIRRGEPLDDVILGHGYESHSGFRSAFQKEFGHAPGNSDAKPCLFVTLIETSLGQMLAAATDEAVCQLEFADRRGLERSYDEMKRRFSLAVLPGENRIIQQLRLELAEYFAGTRKKFEVPVAINGTVFQQKTWRELMRIPHGQTASYEEIAVKITAPKAVRAVARANGANRLYLLVPCHRVIGKNGELSGYGGGVWRKRLLLQLEQTGALPI